MRKFLLYSSALVVGLSGVAEAACIQTPSCSSLGYSSSSSCSGGTKCPFGDYWNCDAINKINSITTQITNLTNKITEQTNKITEQTNTITNLETQITEIKKEVSTANCFVGDILYSDKSCDPNVIASKKPIGVVFDRASKLAIGLEESREYWLFDRANKLAIGLEESNQYWSYPDYFDVPGLSNIELSSTVTADWQGKNNTKVVLEYCKTIGKSCPAFEYVNSYKTEGTQAGDWYLPSMGELYAIYGNKDVLNIALGKIEGTKLGADYYWSSSEHSNGGAWTLPFSLGNVNDNKLNYYYVRPVLAF